jgi:hypothetical protein
MENNRTKARQEAEEENRHGDMKQHADKIYQGLEKLNENHAKRAIWELFQNAIDISDKCEVVITLTDEVLEFKHNGKPFTSKTLLYLIKQVSSKNSGNNNNEVGQYGTGFISTHSFSKKILLSGSLGVADYYIPLNDFEIDRVAKNSDELIKKLDVQIKKVFTLIEEEKQEKESTQYTRFKYLTTTEQERLYAQEATKDIKLILPYVMTINHKLQKVTVIDNHRNETIYTKKETHFNNDLAITPICINQETKTIYSISPQEENIVIILPLEEENKAFSFDKSLSKLFLFYPLIGTENFGFNFLVHSKQFAPTESRDGIYLKSNNEQIHEKEAHNREQLQKIFEMLIFFIRDYCDKIQNIHFFAELNFNSAVLNKPLLSDYYKELKKEWVGKFKTFPLVETIDSKLNPEETLFFSEDLLKDDVYFDSIYYIVSLFWKNIPKKEIAKKWTEYVVQWDDDSIKYITIPQIAEKIEKNKLDYFKSIDDLKHFYNYLINNSYNITFDKHAILPNIKNEFKLKSNLKNYSDIPAELLDIADVIIPDIPKCYIQKDFEFNLQFESYKKEHFVKDINNALSIDTNNNKNDIDNRYLFTLIKYCSIFSDENAKLKMRGEFLKLVIKYYKIEQLFIIISNLPEDWWHAPTRTLFYLFVKELNTKDTNWIKENKNILNNLLSIVHDHSLFKDALLSSQLFPNQCFKLCKKNDLKKDNNIPNELKELYDKIVKPEKPIKETLLLDGFDSFLDEENQTSKDLGSKIEEKLKLQDPAIIEKIGQNEHIQDILKIIELIHEPEWAKAFPIIESKKAAILFNKISDGDVRDDLFPILKLDKDRIASLGELSKRNDFEKIIEFGKAALKEQQQNDAVLKFKKEIGTHIEKLVREKIGDVLTDFKINVSEQQGGQDIIVCYNGKTIYFIEVKSRWDKKNTITMSSVQMKKAVENKDIYSLCCVEMCDYKAGEEDRYNADIQEIIDRITILSDIGYKIEPLLKGVFAVDDTDNEISLTDYRGNIPQNMVKKGKKFGDLVSTLISLLETK